MSNLQSVAKLIEAIHQLEKHKGELLTCQWNKKNDTFDITICGKAMQYIHEQGGYIKANALDHLLSFIQSPYVDSPFVEYHPYIHYFYQAYSGTYTKMPSVCLDDPTIDQYVWDKSCAEWLRTKIRHPGVVLSVKEFEQSHRTWRKTAMTYLKGHYQVDRCMVWVTLDIPFAVLNVNLDLEREIKRISTFRTKLLSQLKNHQLIVNHNTKYLWRIIMKDKKLYFHLLLLQKKTFIAASDESQYKESLRTALEDQINKTFDVLKIPLASKLLPEFWISIQISKQAKKSDGDKKSTKKDTKKNEDGFYQHLAKYFENDFWGGYYRLQVKEPKKMLFGKGQMKTTSGKAKQ